jgi:tetratricopeptide (TPR) repeat protein
MGLFDMFSGKSPERHEARGDEYAGNRAFGDARIEYEKALEKIEKRFPEKAHLKDRLVGKMQHASNGLAENHLVNADAMAKAGDTADARELYQLALDLVADNGLKKKIEARLRDLAAGIDASGAVKPAYGGAVRENDHTGLEDDEDDGDDDEYEDAYDDEYDEYDDDDDDEYDKEIFDVLCNALPADLQEAYGNYGESFMSGYVALNEGDFEYAVEQLENAMAENSPPNLIPLELATALIHLGDHDAAVDLLESFVRQNPEQTRAYQLLCEIYWEKQDYDRAGRLLAKAPDSLKNSKSVLILEGENLFQRKEYSAAASIFEKYMNAHGKDEIVSRALAKTMEASGRIEDAKNLYAEIINSCLTCGTRADPFLKRRYAELCFQGGDTSTNLLGIYLDLAREDPDNRSVYFSRVSSIFDSQGEADEARRYEALSKKFNR